MSSRTANLLSIRPELNINQELISTKELEQFQNTIIRPIIKFQHDLLISSVNNLLNSRKTDFFELSNSGKKKMVENLLLKNQEYRMLLKGMIIGFFTVEEFERYSQNQNAFNKRILDIIKTRMLDNIETFEKK